MGFVSCGNPKQQKPKGSFHNYFIKVMCPLAPKCAIDAATFLCPPNGEGRVSSFDKSTFCLIQKAIWERVWKIEMHFQRPIGLWCEKTENINCARAHRKTFPGVSFLRGISFTPRWEDRCFCAKTNDFEQILTLADRRNSVSLFIIIVTPISF